MTMFYLYPCAQLENPLPADKTIRPIFLSHQNCKQINEVVGDFSGLAFAIIGVWGLLLCVALQYNFNNLKDKQMSSKLKWTEDQEQMLRKLALIDSKRKWVDVANKMNELYPEKQRTSKQCRQKYINHVQYGVQPETGKWTPEDEHTLFEKYLEKGSQWKLISKLLPGRSQNGVKNKFYGKVRKLVRKLNAICRQRINRSNKPLRDQSIMRIIDTNEGFENLPQHLQVQSLALKNELIKLAERDMAGYEAWDLLDQEKVVNLIRTIHKFNINSRYYCSRKKKATMARKPARQTSPPMQKIESESQVQQMEQKSYRIAQFETYKMIPFEPIIVAGQCYEQLGSD